VQVLGGHGKEQSFTSAGFAVIDQPTAGALVITVADGGNAFRETKKATRKYVTSTLRRRVVAIATLASRHVTHVDVERPLDVETYDRPFAQLGRVVVLSATSGGRHVGAVNVTQAISVSSRDGESWAEYEAREALEIAAYDRYLANKLVNRFVDALPARAALATATAAPLQAPSQQSLQ